MNTARTVAFHTLGCKLNFSETSAIGRQLTAAGYAKKDFHEGADVYVINTCSVTENADKECRKIVRDALQYSPEAFVVIIGCYAQLRPKEISEIEGVDLVLGANEKFNIPQYLESISKKKEAEIQACEIADVNNFTDAWSFGDRTRAFLKAQDGCDYSCSFCTIPLARGKSRSDTIESVVNNAKHLASLGIREIVLTGVNLGDFGKGLQGGKKKEESFFELVQALDQVDEIARFRISSIEPNLLSDEIIEYTAQSNRFVPHFHIPLQSGSDKVLRLMRRRYLRELYSNRVTKIKSLTPDCCIGVDVIVGFPGETEADFLETYQFLNELEISYLHVFTYSERPNTDAVEMEGTVPINERRRRNKMLRTLSEKKLRHFYSQQIGKLRPVLFEHENRNGFMQGYTDNYVKVQLPYDEKLTNSIFEIELAAIAANGLVDVRIADTVISSL
jgi:threonylcarbamoyladenosine tRNA methylthiotransferase MtaB